jgi:ADP-ribosyl-[dinitrogen reductase] hydrolase
VRYDTLAMKTVIIDRVKGALIGSVVGDALSMPVHWYYDPKAIKKDFGRYCDYVYNCNCR